MVRIASFVVVLLVVFAAAFGVGRMIDVDPPGTGSTTHADHPAAQS